MLHSDPSIRLSTSNAIHLVFYEQVLQHQTACLWTSSKQRKRLYVNVSHHGRPCQSPWETVSTNRIHCWQPMILALTNYKLAYGVGGVFGEFARPLKSANIKYFIHDYSVLLTVFVTKYLTDVSHLETYIKSMPACTCFLG